MSDTIIALLQNADPQQRKRGIAAAAKSADPRYLKYLARLAKADPNDDLRKLAKKAGTYIHQQQQQQQPAEDLDGLRASVGSGAASAPARDDLDVLRTASGGESRTSAPPVSAAPNLQMLIQDGSREVDPAQAESHYNKAFDLQLKGQDARAALELATAFYLNPAYGNDQTAVAFATEMTGMAPEKAVQYIANPDNWRDLTDKHGGFKRKGDKTEDNGELQSLYLWVAGAVLLLIVFGVFVWIFQSGLIGEAVQQTRFGTPTPVQTIAPTLTPQ